MNTVHFDFFGAGAGFGVLTVLLTVLLAAAGFGSRSGAAFGAGRSFGAVSGAGGDGAPAA